MNPPIRFLHTSDIHFGAGRNLSPKSTAYLDRHEAHLDQLVQIAKERQVSFSLVSGDLFEDARTTIREFLAAARFFRKLTQIGPVVATAGNHDELGVGEFQTKFLERLKIPNLHLVDSIESFTWTGKALASEEDPGPISILASRWTGIKNQAEFDLYLKSHYKGEPIVMLHECFQGSGTDTGYVAKKGVVPPDLDAVRAYCLGDIHKHQKVQYPHALFCGAPMQMNFGDKPGKGCLVWEIRGPFEYVPEFVPIPSPIELHVAYRLEDIPQGSPHWWQLRVPANQIPLALPDCVKDVMPLPVKMEMPGVSEDCETTGERPVLKIDYREGVVDLLETAQYRADEISAVMAEIEGVRVEV